MTAFSGPSSGPFGGDKTTFSALLPREYETDSNKAPVVRAVTALLMVIAILSTTTRLTTKLITVGSVKIDDHLVAAATVRPHIAAQMRTAFCKRRVLMGSCPGHKVCGHCRICHCHLGRCSRLGTVPEHA